MYQGPHAGITALFALLGALIWGGADRWISPAALLAQELPSGWQCLPADCGLALRIADGKAAVEALHRQTRFGRLLLDQQRTEKMRAYLAKNEADEAQEDHSSLADYGLTPGDLIQCLAGESGLAVIVDEPQAGEPVIAGLVWIEPGDELALRLLDAAARWVDQTQDDAHPVRRVDIELENHSVMELTIPSVRNEYGQEGLNLPDDLDQLSEREQEEAWRKAIEERERSRREVVRYGFVLLARLNGRMVYVGGLQPQEEASADQPYVQRLTGIMARFLQAHGAPQGQFSDRVASLVGAEKINAQPGLPVVEMAADPAPFLALVRAKAGDEGSRIFDSLGVQQLGMLLFRMTLDGANVRSGLFVGAPAPRQGLLAVLDQPQVPSEPPAWVPADVVQYGHMSVDLGNIYRQVKEWAIGQFADEARETFTQIEGQVTGTLQSQPDELLSSLGHQHTVLGFETALPAGTAAGDSGDEQPAEAGNRLAVIWQVKESEKWAPIVQAIGVLAGMTQGAARATEEQGFRGWRLENENYAAGLVLGKGSLVLGLGEGTLERTLSCLNHPPQGPDALRSSDLYSRAQSLLPLDTGIGFELTDGNRYLKGMRRWIEASLKQFAALRRQAESEDAFDDAESIRDAESIEEFLNLLPSEDELDGVLGVSVGQTQVNEQGLTSQSVSELPQPE